MGCIIKKKEHSHTDFDIYIRGTIKKFEDYDDLVTELANIDEKDSVVVHLNCPGGDCAIGFFLIDQLINLPCPVHMVVEYPTYSMGAIIALCGNKLTIRKGSYIMFHDYSGGTDGKGEESYLYTTNYRKVFKERFTLLCKPFLTQFEINKMFKGEDLYIHYDDPSLSDRIKRHFKPTV